MKYNVELRQIENVFDFEYPFYDDQFKCEFEDKFIEEYYFNEIGFETVERFKQRLRAKLKKKMPYWTQLYETELESQGISFLLNKDLKETFIRTVDTEDRILGNSSMDTASDSTYSDKSTSESSNEAQNTSNSTYKTNNATTNHHTNKHEGTIKDKTAGSQHTIGKDSNIADGVASVGLTQGLVTGMHESNVINGNDLTKTFDNKDIVDGNTTDKKNETNEANEKLKSKDNSATNNSGSRNGKEKSVGTSSEDKTGKLLEKTDLISQGNIGTTSSAELLEKWREVLINIDEIIIDECNDLFMQIY